MSIGTSRDYFMVLPSFDYHDVVQLEATYSDSQALSRGLLRHIKTPAGGPLMVVEGAADFWTEHGDRATLPSLAACIEAIPTR